MEIKNLSFSFEDQKLIFKDLSLQIKPDQLSVFLGPSGCGKSTLLRILAGLQKVDPDFFHYESKKASFVFQEANLLEWKTGYQNIMLPSLLSQVEVNRTFLNEIIQLLKISESLNKYPSELSGGQKMRISIARALITQPEILFMDEPFAALDEPTRHALQDEIKNIQKKFKMTIVFVTHSFYEAVYLGDRILIFSGNRPTDIVYDQLLEKNFTSRFDMNYQDQVKQITSVFQNEVGLR